MAREGTKPDIWHFPDAEKSAVSRGRRTARTLLFIHVTLRDQKTIRKVYGPTVGVALTAFSAQQGQFDALQEKRGRSLRVTCKGQSFQPRQRCLRLHPSAPIENKF